MPRLLIVLAAAAALSAGCASAASNLRDVKQLLSGELSCPPDKLDVAPAGESLYSAVGCDTELTFKCNEFFGWHCSAPISDVEQAHAGTAHFDGDVGRVTEAAAGALSALGYEIAVQDAGKGLVITKRKVIQAVSTGTRRHLQLPAVHGEGDRRQGRRQPGRRHARLFPRREGHDRERLQHRRGPQILARPLQADEDPDVTSGPRS